MGTTNVDRKGLSQKYPGGPEMVLAYTGVLRLRMTVLRTLMLRSG